MEEKDGKKGEWEKSLRYRVLRLFSFFAAVMCGALQIHLVIRFLPLGWLGEPFFWVGALFWGTQGFFSDEIDMWLLESSQITRIVFVGPVFVLGSAGAACLGTTRFPAFQQFAMWIPLMVIIGGIRVIIDRNFPLFYYDLSVAARGYLHAIGDAPLIKVTKVRWTGWNIQYALLFMEDSLVGARIGGPFTSRDARRKACVLVKDRLRRMSTDEITAMNRENFKIPYKGLFRAKVMRYETWRKGFRSGILYIEGKRSEKLYIWEEQDFDKCRNLLGKFLPEKMVPLLPNEHILMFDDAKYQGTKGQLFLTNRKIAFEYEKRGSISIPLERISEVSIVGAGLFKRLVVNTVRDAGLLEHRFGVEHPETWRDQIEVTKKGISPV